MWPRNIELMLGIWLWISPFVFAYAPEVRDPWVNAYLSGFLVVLFSCLAYWEPARYARFGTLLVGLWLTGNAYLGAPYPAPGALQNEFLTGILLAMFAIIPDDCAAPPRPWRPWVARR